MQWILRYLKGTVYKGLVYGGKTCKVSGFVDSDYARDLDRRRSTIGYVFKLHSAPVSWRSMLQDTVALSTEAEYMALAEAVKEVLWLWHLIEELGVEQEGVELH